MLTIEKLKAMKPGEIFERGEAKILHQWYATAKYVAVRGTEFHDWTIYHSLGFETANFLDRTSHPSVSFELINDISSILTERDDIRNIVSCDDASFNLYRF